MDNKWGMTPEAALLPPHVYTCAPLPLLSMCTNTHAPKLTKESILLSSAKCMEKKRKFFPRTRHYAKHSLLLWQNTWDARLKKKTKNQICVLIHSFRGSDTDTIRDFLLRELLWRIPKAMDTPQITGESTNQTSVMGTLFYSVMMMSVFPIKVRSTWSWVSSLRKKRAVSWVNVLLSRLKLKVPNLI